MTTTIAGFGLIEMPSGIFYIAKQYSNQTEVGKIKADKAFSLSELFN